MTSGLHFAVPMTTNARPFTSITPPPHLPALHARSSECATCSIVFVDVDVVEVNVLMGASMGSLVVDVVEMNGMMGTGMHSLVSCFAVNNRNLTVVEVFVHML